MLLTKLPTQTKEVLSKSITGDIVLVFEVSVHVKKADLFADISFVSLIVEATILLVSNSKFSFSETCCSEPTAVVTKELSEPLGLLAEVVLILAVTSVLVILVLIQLV